MRMKYLMFSFLFAFSACSEIDGFLPETVQSEPTTRTAGDGEYDVLGMGYDVTGEYLHPMSVRNPILDIAKYKKDYPNRIITGTSSYGFDRMYYGYSSSDYIKNITTETKASFNMNYGSEKDTAFFSGSITNNSFLKTEYSYSDKYSFASLDAIRNRKYIRINDEVNRLSEYLSDDFKEDLNRLSPDRIVERYGTHVLTDFMIGGRYKLMFRSVITNSRNATTKKKAVHAGFKASLGKIGFGYNLENTETTDESLVKENRNKELYVLFYGGNGTNLKYDLEKGMPTGVDIQNWENSISLQNSCLNEITWKETYPIYDFISDPIKKEQIKAAVKRYIELSKINILELLPLYMYYEKDRANHYSTTSPNIANEFPGWELNRIECYVLKNQLPGTIALNQWFHEWGFDHYTTTLTIQGWANLGVTGYVYKNSTFETIPLFDYFHKDAFDHYTTPDGSIPQNYPGWELHRISGYVYPAD